MHNQNMNNLENTYARKDSLFPAFSHFLLLRLLLEVRDPTDVKNVYQFPFIRKSTAKFVRTQNIANRLNGANVNTPTSFRN